jgi:maltose alpha-D-glucosyltransferase/alpha-amylase
VDRGFQRSRYQSLRNLTGQLGACLRRDRTLRDEARELADRLVAQQGELLARFQRVVDPAFESKRIRIHGDYHLGALLYTGNSFVIIDLEGDVGASLGERRIKRSPLRDVATMLRSFDYAAGSVLHNLATGKGRPPGLIRVEDRPAATTWAEAWVEHVTNEFTAAYFEEVEPAQILPAQPDASHRLLDLMVLEKALQEIQAELMYRSDWIIIPLKAALRLLARTAT